VALIGAPGTGKTSITGAIAAATGRQLQTFALGGMDDVFLTGIDRSYMHARPGEFMRRLIHSEHPSRWVAVLDEIDKIDPRPPHSPLATLLAVLDGSLNRALQVDRCYESLRVDLGGVLWVATGNRSEDIPAPLRDRLRVIHMAGYTGEQQIAIGRDYLLPRLLKAHEVGEEVQVPEETVEILVTGYPPSEGMRPLEQRLSAVVRRALRHHLVTNRPILVTPDLARSWLPSGEPERRIGFQVATVSTAAATGPARPGLRPTPAISPRRRLRRSSRRASEPSPLTSQGGPQP
jgi:ATP-dependent Lon protease